VLGGERIDSAGCGRRAAGSPPAIAPPGKDDQGSTPWNAALPLVARSRTVIGMSARLRPGESGRALRWTAPPLILIAMVQRSDVKPETSAVVAGRGADAAGAPLNVPPVPASNFQLGSERSYSRDDATPTWEAFEELLGGLEGGEAVAFASGMGAGAAS
jgi:hypothetical protein